MHVEEGTQQASPNSLSEVLACSFKAAAALSPAVHWLVLANGRLCHKTERVGADCRRWQPIGQHPGSSQGCTNRCWAWVASMHA